MLLQTSLFLLLPLTICITSEEAGELTIDDKTFRELEGFHTFAMSILNEERNDERDRLITKMDKEEEDLEPSVIYYDYRKYAEIYRKYQKDGEGQANKSLAKSRLPALPSTIPLRVRCLLTLDYGINENIKAYINSDHVFDRIRTIAGSDLPISWMPPPTIADESPEAREYIMNKFTQVFAQKLREQRKNSEVVPVTKYDYVIPADIREKLVKDPSFSPEVYQLLNYDHQFTEQVEKTLKMVRERNTDIEVVDLTKESEEMLRRRAMPKWKPKARVEAGVEHQVSQDEVTEMFKERLSKLREEQNKLGDDRAKQSNPQNFVSNIKEEDITANHRSKVRVQRSAETLFPTINYKKLSDTILRFKRYPTLRSKSEIKINSRARRHEISKHRGDIVEEEVHEGNPVDMGRITETPLHNENVHNSGDDTAINTDKHNIQPRSVDDNLVQEDFFNINIQQDDETLRTKRGLFRTKREADAPRSSSSKEMPPIDPREVLVSPEYQQAQEEFYSQEEILIKQIIQELGLSEDEVVDIDNDPKEKPEALPDVKRLFNIEDPVDFPLRPTRKELEEEMLRKEILQDFYDKVDAKMRIDFTARMQQKRLKYLEDQLALIKERKKVQSVADILNLPDTVALVYRSNNSTETVVGGPNLVGDKAMEVEDDKVGEVENEEREDKVEKVETKEEQKDKEEEIMNEVEQKEVKPEEKANENDFKVNPLATKTNPEAQTTNGPANVVQDKETLILSQTKESTTAAPVTVATDENTEDNFDTTQNNFELNKNNIEINKIDKIKAQNDDKQEENSITEANAATTEKILTVEHAGDDQQAHQGEENIDFPKGFGMESSKMRLQSLQNAEGATQSLATQNAQDLLEATQKIQVPEATQNIQKQSSNDTSEPLDITLPELPEIPIAETREMKELLEEVPLDNQIDIASSIDDSISNIIDDEEEATIGTTKTSFDGGNATKSSENATVTFASEVQIDSEEGVEKVEVATDDGGITESVVLVDENDPNACNPKLDIVFVLDTSGTHEKAYREHVHWAVALVNSLPLEPDTVRIAAVQYANFPLTEFALGTYPSANDIKEHLNQMNATEGQAHTGYALRKAENELFRQDRARSNASKVIVLFTDGESVDDPAKPAKQLREHKNVRIYVASATEPASELMLEKIAGSEDNVFGPSRLRNLRDTLIVEAERTRACIRIGGPRSEYKHKPLNAVLKSSNTANVKAPLVTHDNKIEVLDTDSIREHKDDDEILNLGELAEASSKFQDSVPLIPMGVTGLPTEPSPSPSTPPCQLEENSCEDAFEAKTVFMTTKPLVQTTPSSSEKDEIKSAVVKKIENRPVESENGQNQAGNGSEGEENVVIGNENQQNDKEQEEKEEIKEEKKEIKEEKEEIKEEQKEIGEEKEEIKQEKEELEEAKKELNSQNQETKQPVPIENAKSINHRPIPTRRPVETIVKTSAIVTSVKPTNRPFTTTRAFTTKNGAGATTLLTTRKSFGQKITKRPVDLGNLEETTRQPRNDFTGRNEFTNRPVNSNLDGEGLANERLQSWRIAPSTTRRPPTPTGRQYIALSTVSGLEGTDSQNELRASTVGPNGSIGLRSGTVGLRGLVEPRGTVESRTTTIAPRTSTRTSRFPRPTNITPPPTLPTLSRAVERFTTRHSFNNAMLIKEGDTISVACPHDILIIVDSSGSIQKTYDQQKKYFTEILSQMKVGPNAHRVAMIQFAGARIQKTEFTFDNVNDGREMMENLNQIRHLTGTTYIGAALSSARHLLENRRRNVPAIVILSSDGYSQDDALAPAERIRQLENVEFYAVSMSDHSNREYLSRVVGSEERVFLNHDEDNLKELVRRRLSCK
ncbi:unnamed protein product [Bursaphelenchus okinawaensis]|uniref:VWFA domain-containing protein n=1 Tax=Bursaphelenchus okinawaensis TaxID=465554 RepID=A0A811KML4_9BILA|nr:unnamed protein product [Bursaphelenchus okinawaensis]CAG9107792.1 unnamed protein product [Bursaphelenchus okinawaensis]